MPAGIQLTKKERRSAQQPRDYRTHPGPSVAHPQATIPPHISSRPNIILPNGRTLEQPRLPPLLRHPVFTILNADEQIPEDDRYMVALERTPPPDPTQHQRKRAAQWRRWQLEVIPNLIPHFVRIMHETKSLRDCGDLALPTGIPEGCSCVAARVHKIAIVRFCAVEDVQLCICPCLPAAVQLMKCGAFPCAPMQPSLAVDMRVLEFCKNLFLHIAPNNTAFATTLERCLSNIGFQLQHQNSLRRRFGNCVMWYIHLRNETKDRYRKLLETERIRFLGAPGAPQESNHQQTETSPGPRDSSPPDASPARPTSPAPSSPTPAARGRAAERRRGPRSPSSSPAPQPRKRGQEATPEVQLPFPDPLPCTRPSEYLRCRCPACFGALKRDNSMSVNFIPCIDACFTQKRQSAKTSRDPPRSHPNTHFVPEDSATQTEAYVDGVRETEDRGGKRHKAMRDALEEEDGYEHLLLRLPHSVLDECEASFKAADEKREKASTRFFEDTVIMGLLCRHDRVLWLINMHSAGEKQFYVIVLLETLFQELPLNIRVGLLYDVACTFERSCRKWGFLSRYMDRLIFAVSVFHAFGHEWPCQLLYHPRKRAGFGFSDGEGCEGFWHSISHLIANLRISGYHNRLYTLDMQIEHADESSLYRLGEWIRRHHYHSANKRAEARAVLVECGQPMALLRAQWALQALCVGRSKNKGQQAVNAVILMRGALKARETQVENLQQAFLNAVMDEDASAPLHQVAFDSTDEALKTAQTKLRQKESALGVTERQSLRGLANSEKFELDKVEHSFRRLVNDQKLYAHTESAVKRCEPTISKLNNDYNKLCAQMSKLIKEKKAPRGAIAPLPIPVKGIWQLDVADGIWQDVGLDDDDGDGDGEAVPPWLGDEKVRSGIKAMLELDQCVEEDVRLKKERRALQEWFAEEWAIVNMALQRAELQEDKYQLQLLRDNLVRLCATWQKSLPDLGVEDAGLPAWGPSAAQLATCVVDAHAAARGEDRHYASDDDEEDGGEDSGREDEDFGTLDAVDTADIYRSAQEPEFYMY
ncbi:hypothetical protein FB451DRAFT_1392915 [Mycena latifolia]|nr:hypothetical protein FB451DRAFT_1392915 [Mycena latifolia]